MPEYAFAAARPLRLGLVGRGIQLSRTPRMHEAEAAAHGIACRYELLDTGAGVTGTLAEILDRAEADGFAGLNVTYPFKQEAVALVDTLSAGARHSLAALDDGCVVGWVFNRDGQPAPPDLGGRLILVVALLYTGWSPRQRRGHRESPHALLQRRLARGEISPEAYEQTKALLDRDSRGSSAPGKENET